MTRIHPLRGLRDAEQERQALESLAAVRRAYRLRVFVWAAVHVIALCALAYLARP